MKTLGWPPNYVARCPVKLFEASGGSNAWMPSGTAGELNMKPLDNMMLHFQLRDMLDNQILFEHTMRKPESFIVMARRFFVIRLENGSFRGFGFTDDAAASEMKKQVQKAVKPFTIREFVDESLTDTSPPVGELTSIPSRKQPQTPTPVGKSSSIVSYESVPRRSGRDSIEHPQEQTSSTFPTLELTTLNTAPKSSIFRSKWRVALKSLTLISPLKGLSSISQMFGWKEHEMEIGYPTDVKHVAHIGWDGPSVGAPNWIDEIKPSQDFSSGPLREFGQPRGPDWIHDALSAAKWTTPGAGTRFNPPPKPPAEFLDSDKNESEQKANNWKVFGSRLKPKPVPKKPKNTQNTLCSTVNSDTHTYTARHMYCDN